jgi:hypothetical protein
VATEISLKPRLLLGCTDDIMQGGFSKTDNGVTLQPPFLPSRQMLVAWVCRLKARHPQLKTFKLVIEYNTAAIDEARDYPENSTILIFEYRQDAEERSLPLIQEIGDLRDPQLEEHGHQFTYQVSQSAITACYVQLMQEAEALRHEQALAMANVRADLPAGNGAAAVPDEADAVD